MTYGFSEFTTGGVLLAPLLPQMAIAFAVFLAIRPALRFAVTERVFANPPLVSTCVYVMILAAVMFFY